MACFSGHISIIVAAVTFSLCGSAAGFPPAPTPCDNVDSDTTITSHNEDGTSWEVDCSDGTMHGRAILRTAAGVVIQDGYFRHGHRIAPTRAWYPNGVRRSETLPFMDHGTRDQTWYPMGQPETFVLHDSLGGISYGVLFSEQGVKILEFGTAPKDVPLYLARTRELRLDKISADIIDEADRRIIGIVGEAYFQRYYRFLRQESEFRIAGKFTEYLLRYQYLPLQRIGVETAFVMVRVVHPHPNEVPPSDFVAVHSGGAILEPAITRERAIDLVCSGDQKNLKKEEARVRFLNPADRENGRSWTWEVTLPSHDARTDSIQVFTVDAVSGDVEWKAQPSQRSAP